jgi:methanogenic corrinoid protein MtbC1
MGVSESSLKRWCDQGAVASTVTPGGHRRLSLSSVLDFVRSRKHNLVRPEVLGLPAEVGRMRLSWDASLERFCAALIAGDDYVSRQVVLDAYLRGESIAEIADRLISPALEYVGGQWECGDLEVYRERRACRVTSRVLSELRSMLPTVAESAPRALGGTPEGDFYELATTVTELTLRARGWNATSLGSSLPFSTLSAALTDHRPKLFWLSVSYAPDGAALVDQLNSFAALAAQQQTAVVVGGREAPAEIADIPHVRLLASQRDLTQLAAALVADQGQNG